MARIRKFQPGVIWPTLFIAPIAMSLFFTLVGADQLQYARINQRFYGPESPIAMAHEDWLPKEAAQPGTQTDSQPSSQQNSELAHHKILEEFTTRRELLQLQCQQFLDSYPKSKRAPEVMWILAQCYSYQLDMNKLKADLVSPTSEFASESSRKIWQKLLDSFPQSRQAALAKWRLGVLTLRHAASADDKILTHVKTAHELLTSAKEMLTHVVENRQMGIGDWQLRNDLFSPISMLPDFRHYENALAEVTCLLWRIEQNDVLTDSKNALAMAKLLDANPFKINYKSTLTGLAEDPEIKSSKMLNNIKLTIATCQEDTYAKADLLKKIASQERSDADAAIEAYYLLGRISLQTASHPSIGLTLKKPEEYFQTVIAAPDNPWQMEAKLEIRLQESIRQRSTTSTQPDNN